MLFKTHENQKIDSCWAKNAWPYVAMLWNITIPSEYPPHENPGYAPETGNLDNVLYVQLLPILAISSGWFSVS